jgi:transposase
VVEHLLRQVERVCYRREVFDVATDRFESAIHRIHRDVRTTCLAPNIDLSRQVAYAAEIGDIWHFKDFDRLASYSAAHPKEQSSGTKAQNPETSWRMAKTGNSYLRSAAYKMAVVGTQHNPVIRAHYLRKRAQGKTAMNALGHIMAKALAVV